MSEKKIEITSGVSIATITKEGKEYITFYPPEVSSRDMVIKSTEASGLVLSPEEENNIIEKVEIVKKQDPYLSEIEVSANFKEGFKFKIKREPTKIIRYFSGRN